MNAAFSFFLLLAVLLPFEAVAGPSCLPQGSVEEMSPDPNNQSWLAREPLSTVKALIEKAAAGAKNKKQWKDNSLMVSCKGDDGAVIQCAAVTLENKGPGVSQVQGGRSYFSDLARRTGHSEQEAEGLAKKYAKLETAFFQPVSGLQEEMITEDREILAQHALELGINSGSSTDTSPEEAALEKQIAEAESRGDIEEMNRLTEELEARKAAAEEAVPQEQASKSAGLPGTDKQIWSLLQKAYPDLAKAAFQTRISRPDCACTVCDWP